ncbi:MAG TPA: gliding motility lipoprotein GldH [Bacteroides sp.]|nr:gliding motility lipoprotein GldH [Bacteroides sp.]HER07765.1 gliding motility lipoprotein GldH [Bacteroides sp.]
MKHVSALPALILMLALSSCDTDMVYNRFRPINDGIWTWEDRQEFPVEITDTASMHQIYLQVRHTVDYPLQNLYMFVKVEGPTGQQLKDTVNMIIAEPDGTWKGKGVGRLKELRLLYRKSTVFGHAGTYTFTLEQGMRTHSLPVTDVGVRIERVNP